MEKETRITPAAARREVNKALRPFIISNIRNMTYRMQDDENQEILMIFYEPTQDYCVNVQITRNLHANEQQRKLEKSKIKEEARPQG